MPGKKKLCVILANALFLPEQQVPTHWLQHYYYDWSDTVFEEKHDQYDQLVLDRSGKPVVESKEVDRSLTTYKQIWTEAGGWLALPRGNWPKLRTILKHCEVSDQRIISPLGVPLRLKPKVLADPRWIGGQEEATRTYLQHGYGVVIGDTGSGKTVIGAGIICALSQRTLILTQRRDGNQHWIDQLRKLTNLNRLERSSGEKIIGEYKASRQQRIFPITVATVQSLGSKSGRRDIPLIQDYFGLILPDEVHELVTEKYHRVVQAFSAAFLAGLTATALRDDRRHYLEFDLMGPVVAEHKGRRNHPTVTFIYTGVKAPGYLDTKPWNRGIKWHICMKEIIQSKSRYDLIQRWLRKDLKAGRRIIVISPQRREIVMELTRRLRQDGYRVAYVDGRNPAKQRKQIYRDVNDGKYDLLCAGKVMNALVDIQNSDTVYLVSPLAKATPVKQLYGRGRDQFSRIRDFADEGGQLAGAVKKRIELCVANGWKIKQVNAVPDAFSVRRRKKV